MLNCLACYSHDFTFLYSGINYYLKQSVRNHDKKQRPVCRRDISSVSNPPIGTSFGPQNIPLPLQVKNPTIGMVFLIRITETHFPHSLETETQLCHKMRLIPMIPMVLHMS